MRLSFSSIQIPEVFNLHFLVCRRQVSEGPIAWEVKVMRGLPAGKFMHAVGA